MHAGPALPRQWALWTTPPADGATNMATDLALLGAVRTDRATWRWYGWSIPTVSFGRHERVAGRYSPASVAAAGLAAVRRPTGGRALLHADEITYSVTFPWPASWPWRQAYAQVNSLLAAALRRAGVPVEIAGAGPPVRPDGPLCFDHPAEGELVLGGRKLVGSAVWRQGDAYLQHGSILLTDGQSRLLDAVLQPLPPAPPAATLHAAAPHRTAAEQLAALQDGLHEALAAGGMTWSPLTPPASMDHEIASARASQITEAWIWGR